MARLLRNLLVFALVAVALGGAAALLVQAARGEPSWREFLDVAAGQRPRILLGASLVLAAGAGWLAAAWAASRRVHAEYLAYETASGSVNISLKALRDFLSHLKGRHEAILQLKPVVEAPGGELDVLLDVKVRAGAPIPALCTGLQDEAKEMIRDKIGVTKIRDVRVRVQEIVPAADRRAARAQDNVEITPEPSRPGDGDDEDAEKPS